jgi:hypothetical protein
MTPFARLTRDPLLHFLVAGGLLFALYRVAHGPESPAAGDTRTITVDRPALLRFMQYESVAFKPDYFQTQLATLSPREERELAARYVREEALFREATTMGLADGDYVIRRRMVQKMLYLLDDAATESFSPSDAQLRNYFRAHEDRYREAPTVTFTQVFVDGATKRVESAQRAAERLRFELNSRKVTFDEAPRFGDRSPFLQNYVGRTSGFIENQLGADFASTLGRLEPSDQWYGPIKSSYGYHLVLLTRRDAARVPEFDQIRPEVRDDFLRDAVASYREKAINDLVRRYTVEWKSE